MPARDDQVMTQEDLAWDANREHWQEVTNALPIPPRHQQRDLPIHVPVTARIEWEHDGVEHLDTVAWAWAGRAVLVQIHDPRRQSIGVWLPAGDVKRT